MQACRLGERIKSHQVGVQNKMQAWGENQIPPSSWCAKENAGLGRESNPIRLVCRRKCRFGERIKSH